MKVLQTRGRARLLFLAVALTLALVSQGSAGSGKDSVSWSALGASMERMHIEMMGIHSTGNGDEDFVRLMLPHHQAAIDMARTELLQGGDPQVQRLAQEIIADQQSEIELMRLWLRQRETSRGPASSELLTEGARP